MTTRELPNEWNNVLYLGPDYRNHRGGIGAVLDIYSQYLTPFKFIPTTAGGSVLNKMKVFLSAFCRILWVLTTDRSIKILHIHSSVKGSFLRKSVFLLLGKLFGKKIVFHLHSGSFMDFFDGTTSKWFIRWIISQADLVLCLSAWWEKLLLQHFKPKQIAVLPNIVESPPIYLLPAAPSSRIQMLFLGKVVKEKGIFDLLHAVASVRERTGGDEIEIHVGGNGQIEKLNVAINDLALQTTVTYHGWVTGDTKSMLINSCDLYVLPSYWEGMPVSILEAMAYGKPVLATSVGGIPEIVIHGYNGWIVRPGDIRELEATLEWIIEHREELAAYGTRSKELIEHYKPGPVMNELRSLYDGLLKK